MVATGVRAARQAGTGDQKHDLVARPHRTTGQQRRGHCGVRLHADDRYLHALEIDGLEVGARPGGETRVALQDRRRVHVDVPVAGFVQHREVPVPPVELWSVDEGPQAVAEHQRRHEGHDGDGRQGETCGDHSPGKPRLPADIEEGPGGGDVVGGSVLTETLPSPHGAAQGPGWPVQGC